MMRWIGVPFLLLTALTRVNAQQLTLDPGAIARGQEYQRIFEEAGERYGVDPRLLWTIGYLETRHNPKLISSKGARGLMQLMPATARRFGAANPFDPRQAIEAAAKYLSYLQRRYGGQFSLILAAYNAGEGVIDAYRSGQSVRVGNRLINPERKKTSGIPPYRETQTYVSLGLLVLKRLSLVQRPEVQTSRKISELIQPFCRLSILYNHQPLPSPNPSQPRSISFSVEGLGRSKRPRLGNRVSEIRFANGSLSISTVGQL